MEREMNHCSHEHPLLLKAEELIEIIKCNGCPAPISNPFYSCGECCYFLHKECAELPNELNYHLHPQHPLTLLSRPSYREGWFQCSSCGVNGSQFVYHCSKCMFDVDLICASASGHRVWRKGTEREMMHFSHWHPLILKAEEREIGYDTNQSKKMVKCEGCSTPISGPFYSCKECGYYLHKVCAELPKKLNYPMHAKHPLTLFSKFFYESGTTFCDMCGETESKFFYKCSLCKFDVDLICASASHVIEDKCHQHPLIPLQFQSSFSCHICQTKKEGLSYKCNTCPFWVHQNCTVSLPRTMKHSNHHHLLTFVQSVPPKYRKFSKKCDICYDQLSTFYCIYYCERCMFFAHVTCARSEEALQLLRARDQNIKIDQDLQLDVQPLILLPEQQKTSDLVLWFAENYSDRDALTNLLLGFHESYIDRDPNIIKEMKFFNHEHPILLIEDKVSEYICDACAQPLSTPSYGCIDCGYFLHKCCTELPKLIFHPTHPEHKISLYPSDFLFWCEVCYQWSNGFCYKCLQCNFEIDIKCASLLRHVKHEGHKHHLIPGFISPSNCSACSHELYSNCILQCNTCSFNLCYRCALAPPIVKHRWDEHPFVLTYSPPENHYNEYICDLCEEDLNPKLWYYYCHLCDQFNHRYCMLFREADSNIKYGKGYLIGDHEHKLTLISCTYNSSLCKKCRFPMRTGYKVGLECKSCDFRIHLLCALDIPPTWLPN